ncbi:sugar ABC transporter substrate-binding protein [Paenibacillus sp. HWE-109]|uniref:ABC transporter substrate-binding protein n=1 Tax=Paenibacillus sp. HWE-109 TaxID=1306526 RepID=UPI001EE04BC7|nr:sugar ABC transporter substrate-binding protein [Paenibacillus sp. HWE-109]UKS24847.1 sugar ABC transporter substrate-binding protein [Paenibacillus sp. HWE-109]
MKKALTVAASVVVVSSLLAGCGSQNTPAGTTTPANSNAAAASKAPAKDVKLTFSIWGSDAHKKMYEDLIANYKKIKPNVSVEIMTIPAADYQQKISVMMASKTAPDIMWMLERAIPQFLTADQIEDISAIKTDAAYDFKDVIPSTLDLVTKNDKLYGVPFSTPPNMIYYNKNLFKEKGLKTPTELYKEGNWTYEEMAKAAQAIAQPDKGVYGFNLIRPAGWGASWIESLQTLVWANGADFFSKDGKKFTLNSPEGQKALQFFSDAMFKTKIHPKPGDQTTFESGKIGMQQDLLSYMGKAKAIKDFVWDIAPMPKGSGGQGTTLGYAAYMVTKGSPNAAEAVEFLKFLSSKENMTVTSQYFVPGRKSVLESDGFLKQGPSPESMKTAVLDQMAQGRVRQGFQNFQKIDDKMKLHFDAIYTQAGTIPDILKKMEQDVSPILAQ